jgi:hypothetical protein
MSDFSEYFLFKMVKIIQYKSSVDELLSLGLSYSQIAQLLSIVIGRNLVEDKGDKGLLVTQLGLEFLTENSNKYIPNENKNWIMPLDAERLPNKFDIFNIYLPERKKY